MPPKPWKCPKCGKDTGFKYVSKLGSRAVGRTTVEDPDGVTLRASCRFCGHVRKEARATES